MIYLYAIVEPDAAPPGCGGIDDEALEVLPMEDAAVLCSTHARRSFPAEPELLWRHDQVLESAMSDGPLLPVRFGTTFADTDALRTALAGKMAGFLTQLEGLRDCVELAVRVSVAAPRGPAPADGRSYLEDRLALQRELAGAAARVLSPLEPLAREWRRRAPMGGAPVMTASYLVPTADVARFTEEVRRLESSSRDLKMSCTGPWAPYSFVGGEAA